MLFFVVFFSIAVLSIGLAINNMAVAERWSSPLLISLGWVLVILVLTSNSLYGIARELRENPVLVEFNLERGCCPACTYPLRTVPAAPDGCRVCPECGGAWRLHTTGDHASE